MKVFKVEAIMRTIDDIDFQLDYFVFIKLKNDDGNVFVMRTTNNSDSAAVINNETPYTYVSATKNWVDAVNAHFDDNVRCYNDRVDELTITEIVV